MNLPCFDATFLLVKLSDEIISFKRWISLPLMDGCKVCGFHPRSGTEKIESLLPKAMMGLEDLILTASFWDGGKFLGGNCCSKLPGIRKGFRTYVERASPTLSFPHKYLPNSTVWQKEALDPCCFFHGCPSKTSFTTFRYPSTWNPNNTSRGDHFAQVSVC